ncbi:MAG TPA: transposase [Leadbetterella sp.]|nr:transposase [Leadbetterella sp.]
MQFFIFSESIIKSEDQVIFEATELGKLKEALPLKELASLLPERKSKSGSKSWLSNEGQIALMFLKHHTGLSDADLIEHLNNNFAMQMFCGIRLNKFERIKDKNLPSAIRCRLAKYLDMDKFQQTCLENWKGELQGLNVLMNDAVVYESYIKYPTDVKLLWDSTSWVYEKMFLLCEEMGIRKPRSKYLNHKVRQNSFSKRKKKSYKENRRRIKQLLKLLEKGLGQLQTILDHCHALSKPNLFVDFVLSDSFYTRLKTIKTILAQQKYMSLHPGKKAPDRIVSLAKPWVRAIVRGKENKPVEFGPKVHMSQTDGINYIEHYSYKAFNETKRLKTSIFHHEQLFRTKCTHYAADNIYPTNENRRYISGKNIYTNFVPKGRIDKEQEVQLKQIRSLLGKQRATVLEGSFGNEKLHYSLNKIKARLESTEKLWVFFGVMTANAVKIASRREDQIHRKAA